MQDRLSFRTKIVYAFIMLTVRTFGIMLFGSILLAGCAVSPDALAPLATVSVTPARDVLYTPEQVRSGRLEYAPDRSTFAPVLTERSAYPTQPQAQYAFLRSQRPTVRFSNGANDPLQPAALAGLSGHAASVKLFACKPGAIDGQTGRLVRYSGPVVVCATDFLDGDGTRLRRAPINFYFDRNVWRMHTPDPPTAPAPWHHPEPSPSRSWNPFGDRT